MKCLTAFAFLALLATPARASDLTPELLNSYAALGAVTMVKLFADKGQAANACTAATHALVLAQTRYSRIDVPTAKGLKARVCGAEI